MKFVVQKRPFVINHFLSSFVLQILHLNKEFENQTQFSALSASCEALRSKGETPHLIGPVKDFSLRKLQFSLPVSLDHDHCDSCVCISLCLCVCVSVSLPVSGCVALSVSVLVCLSVFQSVNQFLCLCMFVLLCVSVCVWVTLCKLQTYCNNIEQKEFFVPNTTTPGTGNHHIGVKWNSEKLFLREMHLHLKFFALVDFKIGNHFYRDRHIFLTMKC